MHLHHKHLRVRIPTQTVGGVQPEAWASGGGAGGAPKDRAMPSDSALGEDRAVFAFNILLCLQSGTPEFGMEEC